MAISNRLHQVQTYSSVAYLFTLELAVDVFSTSLAVSFTVFNMILLFNIILLLAFFSESQAAALHTLRRCLDGQFLAYL